jgi:outer membrane lipopolysaccharide assembly protein LptE/RlpB
MSRRSWSISWWVSVLALAGCGYHLVGTSSALPPEVRRIHIPVFANATHQPELEQRLTDTVGREFANRGHFQLTAEPADADAVLRGEITQFATVPMTLDEQGRATEYQVGITLKAALVSMDGQVTYWQNASFIYTEKYPLDLSSPDYYDRLNAVVDEMSVKFAQSLVTSILEGF